MARIASGGPGSKQPKRKWEKVTKVPLTQFLAGATQTSSQKKAGVLPEKPKAGPLPPTKKPKFKPSGIRKQTWIVGGEQVTAATYKEALDVARFMTDPTAIKGAATIEELGAERAELEERGAFEEVTPRRVELSPEMEGLAETPILGPTGMAIGNVLGEIFFKGWVPELNDFKDPPSEETIREASLREIRNEAFREGVTTSESFGALVEAIPVVGNLIGKYVGGIVEAPYANQKNVLAEINKVKEAASTGQEKVQNGLEDPVYGLDRARSMEEQIARLEGRMKALINTSAILIANTDEVNVIEEAIIEAKEKVNRYKVAASFGSTAQITGTGRIIPSDQNIYFALKDYKG